MKIKGQKILKGQSGYMKKQTKKEIFLTILFFAISFGIYGAGILITGTNKSLFTVIGILGFLPSCKSAIRMFMFLKAPSFKEEIYKEIQQNEPPESTIYELVLTTYETTFPTDCIIVKGNHLCAFSAYPKCDAAAFQSHVETMLKQNGFQNIDVKMLKELSQFLNRMNKIKTYEEAGNEADILQLMCDISL